MRDSGRSVFSDSELERQESSFSICCIDRLNLRPIAVGADSTLTHLAVHVCVPLCSYASAFFMLRIWRVRRSEEHTSELQSLMRISYAVFCLQKKHIQNPSITKNPIINI